MNSWKNAIDFYLHLHIHVALAVLALASVTALQESLSLTVQYGMFLFCSTVVVYSYLKDFKRNTILGSWWDYSYILWICICVLVTAICFMFLTWSTQIITFVCALMVLWYKQSFMGLSSLRNIPIVKISMVCMVWALLTDTVLFLENPFVFSFQYMFLSFIKMALIIYALCIPFEIRDLKYDNERLFTIPQLIGIFFTKSTGLVALLIIVLLHENLNLSIDLCMYLLIGFFLIISSPKRSDYFASIVVESVPIVWFIMLYFKVM